MAVPPLVALKKDPTRALPILQHLQAGRCAVYELERHIAATDALSYCLCAGSGIQLGHQ